MKMPGERRPVNSLGYRIFIGGAKAAIIILAIVLGAFAVIYLSQQAYSLGYESATYEPVNDEEDAKEVEVTIKRNTTASEIGQLLIDEGLIDESLNAFLVQDRLSGLHDEYVPGSYVLNTSMTVDEMLQIICTDPDEEDDS